MANLSAAKKSLRSSARKRVFNDRRRKTMKSALKDVKDLVAKGEVEKAKEALPKAYRAIDKATKIGVLKKNTASRKKSRLTKLVGKTQ